MVRVALGGSPAFDGATHFDVDLEFPLVLNIEFKKLMRLHQKLDVAPGLNHTPGALLQLLALSQLLRLALTRGDLLDGWLGREDLLLRFGFHQKGLKSVLEGSWLVGNDLVLKVHLGSISCLVA